MRSGSLYKLANKEPDIARHASVVSDIMHDSVHLCRITSEHEGANLSAQAWAEHPMLTGRRVDRMGTELRIETLP